MNTDPSVQDLGSGLEPVVQTVAPTKKGGLMGSLGPLGGIVGATIGGTVGSIVPGVGTTAGATVGMSLGGAAGTAGAALEGTKSPSPVNQDIPTMESSPSSTMQDHPEVQLATLMDAKQALQQAGSVPGMSYDDANNQLDQAIGKTKTSLGIS